jgi:hypothetical protein
MIKYLFSNFSPIQKLGLLIKCYRFSRQHQMMNSRKCSFSHVKQRYKKNGYTSFFFFVCTRTVCKAIGNEVMLVHIQA